MEVVMLKFCFGLSSTKRISCISGLLLCLLSLQSQAGIIPVASDDRVTFINNLPFTVKICGNSANNCYTIAPQATLPNVLLSGCSIGEMNVQYPAAGGNAAYQQTATLSPATSQICGPDAPQSQNITISVDNPVTNSVSSISTTRCNAYQSVPGVQGQQAFKACMKAIGGANQENKSSTYQYRM